MSIKGLYDVCTSDMIRELQSRGLTLVKDLQDVIDYLEKQGVPSTLIRELRDWWAIPVVDQHKLKKWLQLVGKK